MTNDFEQVMEEMQASIIEDARKTYSETVIQRWIHPRQMGEIRDPQAYGHVVGPCGDTLKIFLQIEGDRIIDARFLTSGCMTTVAAGCMACELAIGKTCNEAFTIGQEVILENLGGLPKESEHCALLASNTLRTALSDYLRKKDEPGKRLSREN
jgi:nitrogen fixation protein NifU and related proteins